MSLDQLINLLLAVTLTEMMLASGLGVRVMGAIGVARDGRLLLSTGLANDVAVPFAAVILIPLALWRRGPSLAAVRADDQARVQ
jgi:ACR3 family arsenite efflux pump ArsB